MESPHLGRGYSKKSLFLFYLLPQEDTRRFSDGENDLVPNTDEPCGIETLEGNREAELMNQLVPVFFGRNPDWGSTFRSIYSGFITSQQVLELLFPSAVPINPGTWMEQYSEAFHQPPGLMILQLLLPYLQLYMGGLNLERQAHHLLAQLEDGKSSEAEPEFQEARATDSLPMPTPGLEPHQGAALVASEGAAPSPEAELKSSSPEVSAPSSTVPLYNQRVGDSCSIHVHLENQRRMEYKNIVESCRGQATATGCPQTREDRRAGAAGAVRPPACSPGFPALPHHLG
ncbi:ral guanine nucleotide dissociation stimulator-like [Sciurus carolinensis]|uniref:ral guanine nucleotide dissociation stimulator-like n=1 Tax=Sciurus carolinensis TaxID=30640 RepID=UPI001FB38C08|nr:ral guanine nucleotide dissociation stimulator-like [Sciurus carolinensis]